MMCGHYAARAGMHGGDSDSGPVVNLRVESDEVDEAQLTYRTAFHVTVPPGRSGRERWDTSWTTGWRSGYPKTPGRSCAAESDPTVWIPAATAQGSIDPVGELRARRGAAAGSETVRLPRPVFDYVVVHELCHLKRRDHSPEFWALVKRLMPEYEERKAWLEAHEVAVG